MDDEDAVSVAHLKGTRASEDDAGRRQRALEGNGICGGEH